MIKSYFQNRLSHFRLLTIIVLVIPLVTYILEKNISTENTRIAVSNTLSIFYNLLAFVGVIAASIRSRRVSKKLSNGWAILAVAQFATFSGDVLWTYNEVILHATPFPSSADAAYLFFYPLFLVGVIFLISTKLKPVEWIKRGLDISIIMSAASLGFWVFLFAPTLVSQTGVSPLEQVLAIAYPVGDLILLFALMVVLYYRSETSYSGSTWILSFSVLLLIITDCIFGLQSLSETYISGNLLDLGWWYSSILIAYAGLYQAVSAKTDTLITNENANVVALRTRIPKLLYYFPYFTIAGAFVLLVVYHDSDLSVKNELIIGVGFIFGFVILRQLIVLHENEQLVKNLTKVLEQLKLQTRNLDNANKDLQEEIVKRNLIQKKLSYDAMHDALTGLANRVLLINRLDHAIEKNIRENKWDYSVLFLDLDNFKAINDVLGHTVGDLALIELGQRLNKCIRSVDTLARFGGDEFVILLENTRKKNVTLSVANRILSELQRPYLYNGNKALITCSIGIVQGISGYKNSEEILRDVDIAMYTAKKGGKSRFEIFTIEMGTAATYQFMVESEFHRAITNNEFILQFQPIYRLQSGSISGFEALLRWEHPMRGLLEPDDFIPIAEDSGAINPIGDWVLNEACSQMHKWHLEYPDSSSMSISVNISGKQIINNGAVERIKEILNNTGLDPARLNLEITENTFIMDQSTINDHLSDLRNMGVSFSIDDFGTGYSSLSNLKIFSINEIKIDKIFAQGIEESNKSYEICKSIINMAHQIGLNTVVEGIEDSEQLRIFQDLQCKFGQGFFLSKPLGAGEAEKLLN